MKKLLVIVTVVFLVSLVCLKFACRNSNSITSHISNLIFDNNRIELNCVGIKKTEVDILWRSEANERLVIKSGVHVGSIGNDYGPNGLYITIANDKKFKVGHWKTANWHSDDYIIYLLKDLNGYEVKFISDGPDFERTEQEFDLNGKPNGLYRSYYRNGNLSVQSTYKEGLQEGPDNYYFENGKVRATNEYFHGKMNGYAIDYSSDGKIEYKKKYSNGVEIKE